MVLHAGGSRSGRMAKITQVIALCLAKEDHSSIRTLIIAGDPREFRRSLKSP